MTSQVVEFEAKPRFTKITAIYLTAAWGHAPSAKSRWLKLLQISSLWSIWICCSWLLNREIPLRHRIMEAIVAPWRLVRYLIGRWPTAEILTYTRSAS